MMTLPSPKDAIHKACLFRLLSEIYDNAFLSKALYFKGGTCAAMLGYLDRFSVDLDFDLVDASDMDALRKTLENIFKDLDLEIKDWSRNTIQYFLKYSNPQGGRNTIKIDATFPPVKNNKYKPERLSEIDRIAYCQTVETMFANKLVALIERYEKNKSIAGRDLYDIHHFFMKGFRYDPDVIRERRNKDAKDFFAELIVFIEKNVTETVINQDLNTLLPLDKFSKIRKVLKVETLIFLKDETERLTER